MSDSGPDISDEEEEDEDEDSGAPSTNSAATIVLQKEVLMDHDDTDLYVSRRAGNHEIYKRWALHTHASARRWTYS